MASVISRKGLTSALGLRQTFGQPSLLTRALRPATQCQTAGIAHKDHLNPEVIANKTAPWPYERKRYGFLSEYINWDGWFNTTGRFDENSKIITVEGTYLTSVGRLLVLWTTANLP
jgi:hypothetical protein